MSSTGIERNSWREWLYRRICGPFPPGKRRGSALNTPAVALNGGFRDAGPRAIVVAFEALIGRRHDRPFSGLAVSRSAAGSCSARGLPGPGLQGCFRCGGASDEKAAHRVDGARARKQIALVFVAAVPAQELELLRRLDTLGEHPQAQRVPERDDRLRDRRAAAAVGRLDHERPVDLQGVDRQPREVAEARVAGAEVVHRDLPPELLELPEDRNRFLAVVDQHSFGKLELQARRADPPLAQRACDQVCKTRAVKLPGRDVHADTWCRVPAGVPFEKLAAGRNEGPFAKRADQVRLLGDRDELRRRDQTTLWVVPSHERLEPRDAA